MANSSAGGSVDIQPEKNRYSHGDTVTLTAISQPGYKFQEWSEDLSGNENPKQVAVESNLNVNALFNRNPNLIGLTVLAGSEAVPIQPTFQSDRFSYSATISHDTEFLTFVPAAENGISIKINGEAVTSSKTLPFSVGTTKVSLTTSDDEGNGLTYEVSVTRVPSTNALLESLTPSMG